MNAPSRTHPINALRISDAVTPADYAIIKALMTEYMQTELAEDYAIGGGGLREELDNFPGPYQSPAGLLLIAYLDDKPCGCLALRPFTATAGEVVRMYVQPSARGQGVAEMLMRQLIEKAHAAGYTTLYLDSLKRFAPAHKLYEKLGFTYCAPYDSDTTDAMRTHMIFMRRDVSA